MFNMNSIQEADMSVAESFGRSAFARFINTPTGRVVRILAGLVLIVWGYLQLPEVAGIVLIVIGLVPFVAGTFHLCLISALLGGPISGARIAQGNVPPKQS
jgi:hypothetical protein